MGLHFSPSISSTPFLNVFSAMRQNSFKFTKKNLLLSANLLRFIVWILNYDYKSHRLITMRKVEDGKRLKKMKIENIMETFLFTFFTNWFFSLFQLLLYILSKFVSIKMNIRYRNFNVVKGFEELSSFTVWLKIFFSFSIFLILNLYYNVLS